MTEATSKDLDGKLDKVGLHMGEDDKVEWNDDNKDHPRNWGIFAKSYNNAVIWWLEFFMTAVSTAGTSTATAALKDYNVSRIMSIFAFVSM